MPSRAPASGSEVLTVGHSTHPIERFLRVLRAGGVEAIADVRRHPGSRRHPQFNAASLAGALEEAGLLYEQLGETLGGRRRASRTAARAGPARGAGWRNRSFAAYAEHMASDEFAAGLERLEGLARRTRTAFMCAEADWRRCHRRLIADALAGRGWRVLHLGGDGRLEAHPASILDDPAD